MSMLDQDEVFQQAQELFHSRLPESTLTPEEQAAADAAVTDAARIESERIESERIAANLLDLGDGVTIDKNKALELAKFERYLNENPALAARLQGYLANPSAVATLPITQLPPTSPGSGSATPLTPTYPEELEEYAPVLQYLDKKFDDFNSQFQSVQQTVNQTKMEQIAKQVEEGISTWNSQYNFSTPELDAVVRHATELNVLPSFQASGMSPSDAAQKAMQLAFWDMPEIRDRYLANKQQSERSAAKADRDKQLKLSALGGTSGSPPPPPLPNTPEERRLAMTQEIAAAINQE